jgi:hypothetical protein
VFRALVEQPHDLRVELVDGFAMIGNVHSQSRMENSGGRIKSVSRVEPPEPGKTRSRPWESGGKRAAVQTQFHLTTDHTDDTDSERRTTLIERIAASQKTVQEFAQFASSSGPFIRVIRVIRG